MQCTRTGLAVLLAAAVNTSILVQMGPEHTALARGTRRFGNIVSKKSHALYAPVSRDTLQIRSLFRIYRTLVFANSHFNSDSGGFRGVMTKVQCTHKKDNAELCADAKPPGVPGVPNCDLIVQRSVAS